MTITKTPLKEIAESGTYAIKVTTIEQVKALLPDYFGMEDLEHFFRTVPNHREFIGGAIHPVRGPELVFVHPEGKQVLAFDEVEF